MAALKNRTVTAESLDDFAVGRFITFVDDEGNELWGEIVAINTDGSFRVSANDGSDWDVEDGEFEFLEEEEVEDVEEEEGEEIEDVEEEDIEEEDLEEVGEADDIHSEEKSVEEKIMSYTFQELKSFIRSNNIKVPLYAYRKIDVLRDFVLEAIKNNEKREEEKNNKGELSSNRKAENAGNTKKKRGKHEDSTVSKLYKSFAERMMTKEGATREELKKIGCQIAKETSVAVLMSNFFKVLKVLNILSEKNGRFFINIRKRR